MHTLPQPVVRRRAARTAVPVLAAGLVLVASGGELPAHAAHLAPSAMNVKMRVVQSSRGHVHSRRVRVPMSRAGFRLPARTHAGWVTFTATTGDAEGHQLEGFRTKGGATPSDVVDDIRRAVSFDQATSVSGTADTRRDAVLVGGPSVDPVSPVSTTIALRPGTYWFFDFNDFFTAGQHVTVTRMQVVGRFRGRHPRARSRIVETMVDDHPVFRGSPVLPGRRTIAVRNSGDELHEVLIQRVRPGTTDAAVQAYYASGSSGPAPYAMEPALRGTAAMDPGRVAYVRFGRLPAGTYALLCFVPDDETGLPHVVEGMHRVLRMR